MSYDIWLNFTYCECVCFDEECCQFSLNIEPFVKATYIKHILIYIVLVELSLCNYQYIKVTEHNGHTCVIYIFVDWNCLEKNQKQMEEDGIYMFKLSRYITYVFVTRMIATNKKIIYSSIIYVITI